MITGDQIRSARALLGWSAKLLASHAHVGVSTVLRLERSHSVLRGRSENLDRIEKALRAGGVGFLNDSDGVGVRFSGPQNVPGLARPEAKSKTTIVELSDRRGETQLAPVSKAIVR